eukprot:691278-Alexandrium_andersonii.AAC.1
MPRSRAPTTIAKHAPIHGRADGNAGVNPGHGTCAIPVLLEEQTHQRGKVRIGPQLREARPRSKNPSSSR